MGSLVTVDCPCGFSSIATIGGNMETFQKESSFPFYCATCGLVNVNIAKKKLACPTCKSKEIVHYGDPKISIPTEFDWVHAWDDYRCGSEGHLCPKCMKQTMKFSNFMMFD